MEKHFAVSGFVVNQDKTKLLMVHHKKLLTWVIPGGHLELNEYPFEGVKREVLEETGVGVRVINCSELEFEESTKEMAIPNPLATLYEFIPQKGDKEAHIHIDLVYLCKADEQQPLKRQETEVSAVAWKTWDEVLDSDTFPSIKALAKKMLGGELKCVSSDW